MGEWVWVTNLPTVFWPSTVPGQGMILGHSTTDHLEYLSWHVLPASDRKTDENSLNKKCIVSPNKVSGISGCRVGKFSSSMEVDLASQLSPGFSLMFTRWLSQLQTAQQDLKQEDPVLGRSAAVT